MPYERMSRSFKARVTEEWCTRFEEMEIVSPMQFGRIVGPFYQGMVLDRGSANDKYYPTHHLSNLCLDDSTGVLGFAQRVSSGRGTVAGGVTVKQHAAHLDELVSRFRPEIAFPLTGDLTLAAFTEAAEDWRENHNGARHFDFSELLALYTAQYWVEAKEKIQQTERLIDEELTRVGSEWLDRLRRVPWFKRFMELKNRPVDNWLECCEETINRLNLDKLKRFHLLADQSTNLA